MNIIISIICFILIIIFVFLLLRSLFLIGKINLNNIKYKDNPKCPRCKNKLQLVKIRVFGGNKYICNVCGFNDFWWKIIRGKK